MDCLNLFTHDVADVPAYECEACRQRTHSDITTTGETSITIESFPFYLAIHLKRFQPRNEDDPAKIVGMVEYPLWGLTLTDFETADLHQLAGRWEALQQRLSIPSSPVSPPIYDLYAVVCHAGRSIDAGHYVAYALNPYDREWRCFNDTAVTRVSEYEVVNENAYFLFYRRRCVSMDPSLLEMAQTRIPHTRLHIFLDRVSVILPDGIKREGNTITHDGKDHLDRNCFIGGVMTSVCNLFWYSIIHSFSFLFFSFLLSLSLS